MKYIVIISLSILSLQLHGQSYLKTDLLEYAGDVLSLNLDYEVYHDSIWTQEYGIRFDFINTRRSANDLESPEIKTKGLANFGINYGMFYHLDKYLWVGVAASYQYHNLERSNFSCSSVEVIGDVYKCNGYGPQSNEQKTHSVFMSPQI